MGAVLLAAPHYAPAADTPRLRQRGPAAHPCRAGVHAPPAHAPPLRRRPCARCFDHRCTLDRHHATARSQSISSHGCHPAPIAPLSRSPTAAQDPRAPLAARPQRPHTLHRDARGTHLSRGGRTGTRRAHTPSGSGRSPRQIDRPLPSSSFAARCGVRGAGQAAPARARGARRRRAAPKPHAAHPSSPDAHDHIRAGDCLLAAC